MLERLTDGFLDGTIERDVYLGRKANLLEQRKLIEESMADANAGNEEFEQRLTKYLELLMRLSQSQKLLKIADRFDLAKLATSNLRVDGKKLLVDWKMPVRPLANSQKLQNCSPKGRISLLLFDKLTVRSIGLPPSSPHYIRSPQTGKQVFSRPLSRSPLLGCYKPKSPENVSRDFLVNW